MKTFRKILFWSHLVTGLLAGILIFIMCVTGALLSFEKDILEIVESDMRFVEPPSAQSQRLSVAEILNKANTSKKGQEASSISFENKPEAAAVISYGRGKSVYANPYTGEILGEGASGWRGFFGFIERGHRWLALEGSGRTVGKQLNDAGNLIFLFLAISGVYIWFPRRFAWKNFKSVLWFRRGLSGKARNFNWHNVIGFWTSLVLIILTVTGVVISYRWASNLVYTVTGNEPPARRERRGPSPNGKENEKPKELPANLENIVSKAQSYTDWKTISLSLPVEKEAEFSVSEGIYWNKFARSSLTIDAETTEVKKWEPYSEQNSAQKLRSWIRFTHTGETGGLLGQFIGFIACIGGAFLVWTGFSLSLRRFQNWRRKETANQIE